MEDLAGPADVEGQAAAGPHKEISFRDDETGSITAVPVDMLTGSFQTNLSEGHYTVTENGHSQSLTVLPAASYYLDLRPEQALAFNISADAVKQSDVTVRVSATGAGKHRFSVRVDNLEGAAEGHEVDLSAGQHGAAAMWHLHVKSRDEPWTLVVIPDGNISRKQELTGVSNN
jgi:hypothetical protein